MEANWKEVEAHDKAQKLVDMKATCEVQRKEKEWLVVEKAERDL